MNDSYDDIIHLPHPDPVNRQRMSMMARAAQFAPFAALTGYDAAIAETGRYTDQQIELGDADIEELNRTFALLQERLHEHPTVQVTHFEPDARKAGGVYKTITASIKRLDKDNQLLVPLEGAAIPIPSIIDLRVID